MVVAGRYGWKRFARVIALATALACVPLPAFATRATIEQRQAQERVTLAGLEASREQLSVKMAEYVEISRQLERVRQQVSQVTTEIAAADARLAHAEDAMTTRAVQLYRSERTGMFAILLSADSIGDLMDRAYYLVLLGAHDSELISETRLARAESLWLQESLDLRVQRLENLQRAADDQREAIEKQMALQEEKAKQIGADIARLVAAQKVLESQAGSEPSGEFDTDTVMSESVYRDWDSLNVEEIQAFLDQQPGTLKTYRAKDYRGKMATTAQMIADASRAWRINPKVILVKLQKEQSMLADRNPTQRQYDWAMGCGKADSRTYYQYQGFGNQIWFGASKLDKNAGPWKPGISMRIDGSTIHPTNSATYSLYKYTPHFRGTMSFWMLYWRYFGDPLAVPQEVLP